ncbi:MAG TPA: crosslink repair DNA glycosylase YcaQ family protein, partial [Mycobacteriales bacterium]|nr:crosslink repair DNA glycosylase YcaQ family protein [Mycobacteriales bacterium]
MHELSRTEARRIAVRAQLLDAERPTSLLETVRHLTVLQIDPTAAVAPSVDLVLASRLGRAYHPDELSAELAARTLLELRQMIRPAEDLALYRAEMAEWREEELPGYRGAQQRWVRANDACRRDILRRITDSGPLTARELPDTCVVPWKSSGWNDDRNVGQLLDLMVRRGEVAVAGRRGRDRLWDLASRVYPDDPVVPADKALRTRNELRLRSLGIARARGPECPVEPADVGDVGEPAVVEGVRGEWRVDPEQLGRRFAGRTALLSPLDRLIHERKRMAEIFDFDYQLEMYKPAAKRRWGYYALPILYGDRLVGKVDATADQRAGVLRVAAIHQDVDVSPTMARAVDREVRGEVAVVGRQDGRDRLWDLAERAYPDDDVVPLEQAAVMRAER